MIIEKLDYLNFIDANKMITNFTDSSKTISDEDLKLVLKLKDYELISTFLEKYNKFKDSQLKFIEVYINENLDNEDRDFVSDLIEFSSKWGLNIDYKKLLYFSTLDTEEEHFVVLSTINYLTENIKLFYFDEIVTRMKSILDNSNFYQNVQISASLCLFKITQNTQYLIEVKDWFDNESNKLFLENTLKLNYYLKEGGADTIRSVLFGKKE